MNTLLSLPHLQGQHLVAAGSLAWDARLNAILDAANRHADMKQVGYS